MTEVKIVMPTGALGASDADDMIDTAMRVIGVGFAQPDEWASKYGTDYENDVFMMHRFCWCEREECGWCSGDKPNFLFKPTGFSVTWYKYIGRGMELSDECLPNDFLQQIFATHPKGMTVDKAIEELARREEETAKAFHRVFESFGVKWS
jgi:hypothetical protein